MRTVSLYVLYLDATPQGVHAWKCPVWTSCSCRNEVADIRIRTEFLAFARLGWLLIKFAVSGFADAVQGRI